MSLLSELIGCVDFNDEFIVKLVKDFEHGHLEWEDLMQLATEHERRFKLAALVGKNLHDVLENE